MTRSPRVQSLQSAARVAPRGTYLDRVIIDDLIDLECCNAGMRELDHKRATERRR